MSRRASFGFLALLLVSGTIEAQPVSVDKTEAMVAMRDGVRLRTVICKPKKAEGLLPFLLMRTPYNAGMAEFLIQSSLKELFEDGYIVVVQDIRGRYASEGKFVMMRPPRKPEDPEAIDEGTDAFDTIDWLLKNVEGNNGRAGMLGISYPGWTTVMALIEPHPALKAASPQASPADMFLGDDFHHNGAFRLSYGFEYAWMMEAANVSTPFPFDRKDTFQWYLDLGSLANANPKFLHEKLPTWNDFAAHPDYDSFWRTQAVAPYLKQPRLPTLNVAGWWDQEDFFGPLKIYDSLENRDQDHQNFLVVGPWNHGGWSNGPGDRLGPLDFGKRTGEDFRKEIQAAFFAHYLKDRDNGDIPEARTFRTGANAWQTYDHWPPREAVRRKLHVRQGGKLAFDPPPPSTTGDSDKGFDEYLSDPNHPVPYRNRPIQPTYGPGSQWSTWLLQDQRFVHLRPDVLSFETEPLSEDLDVAGSIVAHLFASTTGTDSDWIIKVIDVYPDDDARLGGYQLMVADEVFRARFRNGFDTPEPLVPDQVEQYTIDTHGIDHRFRKGHRIMLQVQSSWFPLIDRNPQNFVSNIFQAKETDFRPATQRVYRSPQFATYLELPVIPSS
jgi:putative CocE/NonD family hydrolase